MTKIMSLKINQVCLFLECFSHFQQICNLGILILAYIQFVWSDSDQILVFFTAKNGVSGKMLIDILWAQW